MNYWNLFLFTIPEAIVALAALVVLFVDLQRKDAWPMARRRLVGSMISSAGCLAAVLSLFCFPQAGELANGVWVVGSMSQFIKGFILVLSLITVLLVLEMDLEFTPHLGEYYALLLLATLGFMCMVSTREILMIFVSLELSSLSLYLLTAFAKRPPASTEAAIKYFLFGSVSAAFMLFGLSLIHGLTGETQLASIALKLKTTGMDPLLIVGIVMIVIGLGFKIASAPFHWWAPDVYEAGPVCTSALIASGSKVAGFVLLVVFMIAGFSGLGGSGDWRGFKTGWVPLLAGLSLASMILGNLAAMVQTSVRRLLAYSAIAHGGYALVGLLPGSGMGVSSVVYYVLTYALTVLGAFIVVAVVAAKTERSDAMANFAGLSRRAPLVSLCMMVFMLSLAGIPPLAGFFGKFYLFASALKGGSGNLGLLWLVVFAIAMSAVSLYYYLLVLKQIYVVEDSTTSSVIIVAPTTRLILVALALAVVILGAAPDLMLNPLTKAVSASLF
jgi:NADH-quinone oxidoreductase subunit N